MCANLHNRATAKVLRKYPTNTDSSTFSHQSRQHMPSLDPQIGEKISCLVYSPTQASRNAEDKYRGRGFRGTQESQKDPTCCSPPRPIGSRINLYRRQLFSTVIALHLRALLFPHSFKHRIMRWITVPVLRVKALRACAPVFCCGPVDIPSMPEWLPAACTRQVL